MIYQYTELLVGLFHSNALLPFLVPQLIANNYQNLPQDTNYCSHHYGLYFRQPSTCRSDLSGFLNFSRCSYFASNLRTHDLSLILVRCSIVASSSSPSFGSSNTSSSSLGKYVKMVWVAEANISGSCRLVSLTLRSLIFSRGRCCEKKTRKFDILARISWEVVNAENRRLTIGSCLQLILYLFPVQEGFATTFR